MKIINIESDEFLPYGRVLNIDSEELVHYFKNKSIMPKEGNIYVRDDIDAHSLKGIKEIHEEVYGLGDIEVGYCNGFNSKLNCLEYHTCPEVNVAGDDLVLLLALHH